MNIIRIFSKRRVWQPLVMHAVPALAWGGWRRRDGVAIILVLGMMGIFLISATAFSIAMRVERQASSNYRFTVQARHLLWAALSAAIEDIHTNMTDMVYPPWAVLASGGNSPASLVSRAASPFIPIDLQTQVDASDPQWRLLRAGGGTGAIWGRYSYLILNTSGYLDANVVGGTNRMYGAKPAEIQIGMLPEVQNAGAFRDDRNSHYRFETLAEFNQLADGIVGNPEHFSVYSLAIMNEVRTNVVGTPLQQIDINGKNWINDSSKVAQVSNALVRAGIGKTPAIYLTRTPNRLISPAALAMINLRDFVDEDSKPGEVLVNGQPCRIGVESVPMLNEVIASNVVAHAGGAGVAGLSLKFEWHYPFVASNKLHFSMAYDVRAVPATSNQLPQGVLDAFTFSKVEVDIMAGGVAQRYGLVEFSTPKTPYALATNTFKANYDLRIKVQITSPEGIADEVPSPWNAAEIVFPVRMTVNVGEQNQVEWMEFVDPRFNHVTTNPYGYLGATVRQIYAFKGWPQPGPTPLAINNFAQLLFTDPTAVPDDDLDMDTDMYVGNRALRTVGELGHITYDYWRTIRLYRHDKAASHAEVLDYFTLTTNEYRRGLVNINTTNESILASVFYGAPYNEHKSGSNLMDENKARALAQGILTNGPYIRISEPFMATNMAAIFKTCGASELERESAIRNSMDLFTVRQNLFTIFLGAESFSEMIGGYDLSRGRGGNTLSRARAVAELWRDPFVDTNGVAKCFVRYFKILDD